MEQIRDTLKIQHGVRLGAVLKHLNRHTGVKLRTATEGKAAKIPADQTGCRRWTPLGQLSYGLGRNVDSIQIDATLYEGEIVTPAPAADVKTGPAHELGLLAQGRQDRVDEWDRKLVPIAA